MTGVLCHYFKVHLFFLSKTEGKLNISNLFDIPSDFHLTGDSPIAWGKYSGDGSFGHFFPVRKLK